MTKFIRNIRTSRLHAYDRSLLDLGYYAEYDDDPKGPPEQTQQIEFYLSALGIGDAVCGYYAACGIANAGLEVTFHSRHQDWLARVAHPGVSVAPETSFKFDANLQYEAQHGHAAHGTFPSRPAWYISQLRRGYVLPESCAPARPREVARMQRTPGSVVVFPAIIFKTRQWPVAHWRELVARLRAAGATVTAMGMKAETDALNSLGADVVCIDAPPAQVLDAIQRAALVIAHDSGMTHIAGLYETPALALLGPTSHDYTFACGTSIRSVPGPLPCTGCYWRPEKGYEPTKCAGEGCPSLRALTVETVFQEAMNAPDATQAPRESRRVRRKAVGTRHL